MRLINPLNGETTMKTVIYGAKTFILENPCAADLMVEAAAQRSAREIERAQTLVGFAGKVETGAMTPQDAAVLLARVSPSHGISASTMRRAA